MLKRKWTCPLVHSYVLSRADKDDSELTKHFRSMVKEKKDGALPHKGAGDLFRVISLSVWGDGSREFQSIITKSTVYLRRFWNELNKKHNLYSGF